MLKVIKNKLRKPYWFLRSWITYCIYSKDVYFLYWHNLQQNFGDSINPLLLSALTGKKIINVTPKYFNAPHMISIGSIIEHSSTNSLVWGSGFISKNSTLKEVPKKIYAVRGPKTRQRLLEYGINCPEVYGDPVLLLPKVYSPKIIKKYKLGIIPHYIDQNNVWIHNNVKGTKEIKIIDLQKKDLLEIVDDILSCEKIVSSSLHGIITADAYAIPSIWIEFSDKVYGNGFKFLDYFESVGRKDKSPFPIDDQTELSDLFDQFYDYTIDIDLEKLLNSAPFDCALQYIEKSQYGQQ